MKQFFTKCLCILLVSLLFVSLGRAQIAAWDFTGQSAVATVAATTFNTGLVNTSGATNITRGAGATASAGSNSFGTTGFENDGISTANTDYFQVTLTAASGYVLYLSTIDATFNGTSTYYATPGVTSQFAYSLDGTNFTLIGSPIQSTSLTMAQVDLSSITALQHVAAGVTVTLRYYASGQTGTGDWGFYSPASGSNGLAIGGTLAGTGTSAATDNFRSAQTGDWNNTSSWISSPDGVNWITATLVPTSSTAGVYIKDSITISSDASVRDLNIGPDGVLTINNGTTLTVSNNGSTATDFGISGTVYNSGVITPVNSQLVVEPGGNLIFLSTSPTATGSLGNVGTGSIAGNVTVQQNLTAQRAYRLLGHPFNGRVTLNNLQPYVDITGSGTGLTPGNPSAFNYLSGVWTADTSNTDNWNTNEALFLFVRGTPGQGLGVTDGGYSPSAPTISLTGLLNTGNMDYTVKAASSFSDNTALGWNAIGNPYPAPINVNTITNINAPGGSGASVYLWNATKGSVGTGTASGGYDFYTLGNNIVIPEFGAFFIKNTSGIDQTITFTENNKSLGIPPYALLGANTNTTQSFLLTIEDDATYWDKLKISFDSKSSTASSDKTDLDKFSNINLDFYSIGSDNNHLAINSRPFLQSVTDFIPLGLKTNQQRTFTVKASEVSLTGGSNLYLYDKYTNKSMQIANGESYDFSVTTDSASQGNDRFEIVMKVVDQPVIAPPARLTVEAGPNPVSSLLTIRYASPEALPTNIRITDMNGKVVNTMYQGKVQSGVQDVATGAWGIGVYIIQVDNGKEVVTKKVVKE